MYNAIFDDVSLEKLNSPLVYQIATYHHSDADTYEHIHWHDAFEISYVLDGEIDYLCDMQTFTAKPRNIMIINQNRVHSCKPVSKTATICYLIIKNSFLEEHGINLSGATFKILVEKDKYLCNLFCDIISEMENKPLCYKSIISAKTLEIAVYIARMYSEDGNEDFDITESSKKLLIAKRAVGYIHSHYKKPINLDEMATEFSVSKCHLCRVFKFVTSQTLTEYINSYKMHKAHELLKTGKYTVDHVSNILSFSSPSYFRRVYKKHIGHSPSQDITK